MSIKTSVCRKVALSITLEVHSRIPAFLEIAAILACVVFSTTSACTL